MELFGSMPDTLKFVIVFVLILGILVPLVWRWFNVGSLKYISARGRQQRLTVVESSPLDVRHRLVLVKRDNVEHLLLVGGPTSVVVESNIARSGSREPRPIPDARSEPPQLTAETPDWSLPLEPARPPHTVDLDAALPEPPARTAREAMADSMRAVRSGAAARRTPPVDVNDRHDETADSDASDGYPEPNRERTVPAGPRPVQAPAATSPARPGAAAAPAATDEGNFAEMAQRLEAALRRPTKDAPPRQSLRQEAPAGRRQAPPDAAGRARTKSADTPPPDLKVLSGKGKNELAMDSLEDEMAKMLGRPGKS